jgi:hypothetical protein
MAKLLLLILITLTSCAGFSSFHADLDETASGEEIKFQMNK